MKLYFKEGGSFVVEVHIVQKGDTLWKISRQHGISFEELKRVNAHLANPDYIVPGMKIFLPESKGKAVETKQPSVGGGQEKGKPVEKIVKVEKKEEPVAKPAPPKAEMEKPKEPIPLPTVPKPPTITSKPAPPKPQAPKEERPKKQPTVPKLPESPMPEYKHPTPNVQQPFPQMVPMQHYPIIGIPCGWFPIYDADCYSYLHHGQMQHMHTPHAGQLPVERPTAKPCNPATRPIQQERPAPKPESVKPRPPMPMPQLQEPILSVPSKVPNIEAPEIPVMPPRVEQERPTYNRPQTLEEPPRQHLPYEVPQQYPAYPGHPAPCGCNQLNAMPMPQMQQMPMQAHPFCNTCHQPIQHHPMFYPMPYPWQGS